MIQTPVRKLHILVADDHPINLRTAVRLLRELGHGGVVVSDGAQALKALDEHTFDAILMDASMPVLDGVSAVKKLRERETNIRKRTPVIMVTGHDLPEDRERFKQAGADGFLAKPIERDALLAELSRLGLVRQMEGRIQN